MGLSNRSQIRGLLLDMDGVLWRDQQPIGDLPIIFAEINRRELKYTLVTNNATLSIQDYQDKLGHFGVQISRDQILNSAQATAHHLSQIYPGGGPLFIIGEKGMRDELGEFGFYASEDNPLAVVVGLDRNLGYVQLKVAALLIRKGLPFIATNPDRTLPTPEGLIPGAGAILAALQAATDSAPIVIGKPSPTMYHLALERMQLSPSECLVVGDRLETDIAAGQQIGCMTALVLSGVTNPSQAAAWRPAPDKIAQDLSQLLSLI